MLQKYFKIMLQKTSYKVMSQGCFKVGHKRVLFSYRIPFAVLTIQFY